MGIQPTIEKSLNRVLDGTALGIDLVRGKSLIPRASKLLELIMVLCDILIGDHCLARRGFASVLGSLSWVCLISRPTLSVFHRSYAVARDCNDPKMYHVPSAVRGELILA